MQAEEDFFFFFFYGADPGVADPVENVPRRYDMTLLTGPPPAGEARTEYLASPGFLGIRGQAGGHLGFLFLGILDWTPSLKKTTLAPPGVLTMGKRALISIEDAPAARQL